MSKNTKTDVNEPDENETVYAYFYGTEPDSNYIDITLSDEDCGLASYEINLYDANGERIIAQAVTGLEEGIEKTTTLKYTTAVTNPETGEVSEHTTSEDVTYISPVKQAEAERIVFTEDGDYYLEVIVTDIDGNRTAIKRKYVVDTTAPSIESLNYEIESGILNYLTFGIYGNQNISLSLKINDGQYGTGVESKNVVLYWGGHEYKSEQNNDGKYVFNLEVNDPLPDTSLVPYIIVTDRIGHESKYYFTTIENATNIPAVPEEKLVIDDGLIDEKNGVILVLESEAPTFTITPTGKAVRTDLGNSGKELYFGRSDETESNMLNFTFEDNEGLGSFDIKLYDSEGKECQDMNVAHDFMEKEKLDERTINIDKLDTGRYKISVDLKDVAGNTQSIPADCQFNYSDFYVDKTAPTIIDTQYEVVSSILKYLSFGIFGKETITISVKVEDNQYGSGVESVELMWGDDKKHCYTSEEKDGVYTFKSLEPEYEAIPRIVVKDKLGNEETYYFTTNKQAEDNNNNKGIGELIIDDTSENHISLALEKNKPDVNINVPENYDEYIVAGETWYATPIEYIVSASDVTAESNVISGINRIEIEEDDSREVNSRKEQKFVSENGEEYVFEEKLFRDTATYTYPIEKDGHYKITANAYDNAENSNSTEKNFSIDVENPKIIRFHFGDFVNDEPFFERDYGYFFMEKTAVRIYVEDLGTSSGFCEVHLYLQGVSGEEEIHHILSGSQLLIDEITGEKYALFAEEYAIPMGFKGNVYAEVIDNVRHTSEKISADGNIIENNDIHKDVSGIDITENTPSYRTDANNNMLYNSNIPLTISVNDNFSGISTIEWSIAGDNESGTITVDIDGNIINNSEAAFVLEDSVVMEKNLVTALKFGITVDNNINGNFVNVTLTDRSGNISSNQKIYSIDMTEPTISAVMSNTTPSNSTYYNTTQDITIYITERNFNPNDVKVLLNETEQPVTWNQNGDTEKSDTTVYTGNFSITNDGKYTFSVEYADMAGNIGNTFIQPGFTIDTTAPQVVNNFEDFGKIGDEYIYYNLKQRDNAKAIISVKEANFNELDMNVNVSYKDPGNSHTDSDWKTYKYTAKWKQEGDMNTLVIPFTEDNVYKIQMSPKDRAGNPANFEVDGKKYPDQTAVFEADYTVPVITERSGKGVKEDDVSFIDFYDFERRSEESPSITFQDTNIERIDYYIRRYTPVYTNGKEIGKIEPLEINNKVETIDEISDTIEYSYYVPSITYNLENFLDDGVYSVKLTAYDKAGNASKINDNTFIRMISIDVLAYIENSNSKTGEGWYSFENENGPISKQPDSFSDLDIVVLSKLADKSRVCLIDKATTDEMDTKITSSEDSLFDKSMYKAGAYRYTLPGKYFEETFTADADTNLYLRVENAGNYLDIGEIYIDNTDPTCNILSEHYKSWGYFSGSGNQTITFDSISEELNVEKTEAYIDGETISVSEDGSTPLKYSRNTNELLLTLTPGSHTVGLLLVDMAQNSTGIPEVQHLAIGIKGLWQNFWYIVVIALLVLIGIVAAVIIGRHIKNKRIS